MSTASDFLAALRAKQERLVELKREVASIEAELSEAADLLAGRKTGKPKSRHGFTGGRRARPIQEGSSVDLARQVLKDTGDTLHLNDLVMLINTFHPEANVKAATLASNLSRYIMHDDTFTRPKPNTFGLAEWDTNETRIKKYAAMAADKGDSGATE